MGGPSPDIPFVTELDKLTSGNDEPQAAQQHGETSNQLKDLAQEFSTGEKTSPAVGGELAKIIQGLINNRLPKAKLDELHGKYLQPENCNLLLAPKASKTIWSQFKDSSRKAHIGKQKCQALFLRVAYATIQASWTTVSETKTSLSHALVLILSGNREFNLKSSTAHSSRMLIWQGKPFKFPNNLKLDMKDFIGGTKVEYSVK